MKFYSYIAALSAVIMLFSCMPSSPLEGKWEYDGGKYNGKIKNSTPDFIMQRTYTGSSYEAYLIDGSASPVKYGAGIYKLKADTFMVTSTYSSQPSQSLGKTINYLYKIEGERLTISGILPDGMIVEEYWKKLN